MRIREFLADRRARNFERKEWLQPTTMDPDDEHWAQRAHARGGGQRAAHGAATAATAGTAVHLQSLGEGGV